MDINVNINLRPSLSPNLDKPVGKSISYSEARNLPVPNNMEHVEHKVKPGETLASISEQYGLTAVQLSEFMRETEGNDYVAEGQTIKIPTQLKEV